MPMSLEVEPGLRLQLEQTDVMRCRFCGCSEFAPCEIALAMQQSGMVRLARDGDPVDLTMPCGWYIDEVCTAPACLEKLLAEWRGKPVGIQPELGIVMLYDATGRKIA